MWKKRAQWGQVLPSKRYWFWVRSSMLGRETAENQSWYGAPKKVSVWRKTKVLGQTAGLSLWFRLPFGAILVPLFLVAPSHPVP